MIRYGQNRTYRPDWLRVVPNCGIGGEGLDARADRLSPEGERDQTEGFGEGMVSIIRRSNCTGHGGLRNACHDIQGKSRAVVNATRFCYVSMAFAIFIWIGVLASFVRQHL